MLVICTYCDNKNVPPSPVSAKAQSHSLIPYSVTESHWAIKMNNIIWAEWQHKGSHSMAPTQRKQ